MTLLFQCRYHNYLCQETRGKGKYQILFGSLARVKQEPYDFTQMWDMRQKATKEQIKQTHRHRKECGCYQRGRGWGEIKESKVGQIYGDRRLDFRGEHIMQYIDDVLQN